MYICAAEFGNFHEVFLSHTIFLKLPILVFSIPNFNVAYGASSEKTRLGAVEMLLLGHPGAGWIRTGVRQGIKAFTYTSWE